MIFSTILEALSHHATQTPDKVVFTWVNSKCVEQNKMTFKQLVDQSNAVAAHLLKLGCQKGDRVMVAYPFGLEFLAGMFGAMKVGVIPCSIYPPNPNQLKTDILKFRRFAEDAGAKYALSTTMFATTMKAASVLYKTGVTWIGTDKLQIKKSNPKDPSTYETYMGEPEDICFIQYTSGSTGRPKGVMISHSNLVENVMAIDAMSDTTANADTTVGVLWVPQYHDMGLVAGFMSSLLAGTSLVMASPLDFVANPLLWSDMVETYKATLTCAPNFAYALLLKRMKQSNKTADWSCVRRAMFGGEPAHSHVVEAVSKTLSIKPGHIYNVYGLAESVVFLTGGPAHADAEGLISCGEVDSPTLKLRIVRDGIEALDGQVGTIWAQSPRVTSGYYGQPKLTTSTFANVLPGYDGTWLDTGDLGKIVDGQLNVTGRVKDVIIINGKNYYPTDVELSIDETFGHIIRPGRTAAFQHGDASVGITTEARKGFEKSAHGDLAVQIANHVAQFHGLSVVEVVVLKLGVTPKTTSGKLKRSEIRQLTLTATWNKSSVLIGLQRHDNILPMEKDNLPKKPSVQQHCLDLTEKAAASSPGNLIPKESRGADFFKDFNSTLASILGPDFDTFKTWQENGLTSLKSAELRNLVEEEFCTSVPANFEQLYPTPEALQDFLQASVGKNFPKNAMEYHPEIIWNPPRATCGKLQLGIFQSLSALIIILFLMISVLPSYFAITWVMYQCNSFRDEEPLCLIFWMSMPLVFPLFIFSFSMLVIFCKYTVIGKYRRQQFDLLTWNYIQWWFMDRLIEVWESIAGQFVLETKFIWVFYWLLGADLAWSAKIEAYIREFDLVKVGSNATVGFPVRCRKFSLSTGSSPRITFHPIIIGKDSLVSGMVSLGAVIGDGSKVEKLSVVEEGAIVPDGVLAKGNPACHCGSFEHSRSEVWQESFLDIFKILWMFSEAYHFFTLSYVVHITLIQVMPMWRYEIILHWLLLFLASSFLALLTSIPLKWLLIGKRDPSDEYESSLYRRATNWACDFHFSIAAWPLTPFFGQTRLWHIILFLHGLDVDIESCISNPYRIFIPSKVDFVKIRKSFIATSTLDLSNHGESKIEIIKSSIGYNVNVHAGVKIMQSAIPPRSNVADSIYDFNHSCQAWKTSLIMDLFLPEVLQLLVNAILFASLMLSYELGLLAVKSASVGTTLCGLAAAIVLQLFLWLLLTRAVEKIALSLPTHPQQSFFGIYINHVWQFRNGNWLEMLLHGTPMFAYYARRMGAEVDGDLWYYGNSLYEYAKLHFHGCTIVDDSHVSGHYIDGNGITIGDTSVSGVVHPGCYASAGSVVSGENGPWKFFLKTDTKEGQDRAGMTATTRKQFCDSIWEDESARSSV
ncbi:D-alanine--D-alanyl carrier protein ligase [Seminavis robusta]|uniref:D-alanine--D-alanyl carrier protein ligase n=1 Tax=Seminavis robusta TaxID=568900 RepID=A0A9N8D6Q4_9STRA|nr:D-alanine--D-alanyl carrier protein ligase [Seminavis robusta]|eukprot:Sro14_g010780.1 D-alanine--D-alanyl carrier protein ligase (1371) ;mRNA; f:158469-162797